MFTKGEVVWAKIKGFPWWPAVVAKVIEDRDHSNSISEILVNFVGENSHASLSLDKVAKFEENYDEFAKMKKKKLLESIDVARKIISGQTSYEDERERLERREKGIPQPIVKRKKETKSTDKETNSDEETEETQPSPVSQKKIRKSLNYPRKRRSRSNNLLIVTINPQWLPVLTEVQ